jgi:hypothetical protein
MEKPTVGSPFFGAFPSDRMRRRMSMYIFYLYQQIPVNYTSEFREIFEAAAYIGCIELFT